MRAPNASSNSPPSAPFATIKYIIAIAKRPMISIAANTIWNNIAVLLYLIAPISRVAPPVKPTMTPMMELGNIPYSKTASFTPLLGYQSIPYPNTPKAPKMCMIAIMMA